MVLLMKIYDVLDWMPGDPNEDLGKFSMFQLEQIGGLFSSIDETGFTKDDLLAELKAMDFKTLIEEYTVARTGKQINIDKWTAQYISDFEAQIKHVCAAGK